MQLSEDTVADVYRLILALDDYNLDQDTKAIVKRIEEALQAKLDAIERRHAYTDYKTASNNEIRENARQKYLNLVYMNKEWRWSAEKERKCYDI